MYKSNLQRNGQSIIRLDIRGIPQQQWRMRDIKLASGNKTIVYSLGYIYFIATRKNSRFASFYKVNAETGEIAWALEIAQIIRQDHSFFSSPTISDRFCYFLYQPTYPDLRSILYCLDIVTQRIIFEVDVLDSMGVSLDNSIDSSLNYYVRSSVAIIGQSAYLGTSNGYICSFDANTGQLEWKILLTEKFGIGHVTYAEDCLYVESTGRTVYAVDISGQTVKWKIDSGEILESIPGWYNLCPLAKDDKLYLFSGRKAIYAVERRTGTGVWKYSTEGDFACGSLIASENALLINMPDSKIHAVNPENGRKIWDINIGKPVLTYSPPVVVENTLLLTSGGDLLCINVLDGEVVWRWRIPFSIDKIFHPEYLFSQVLNVLSYLIFGNPGFAAISTPCMSPKDIFIATEIGSECSLYSLRIQS